MPQLIAISYPDFFKAEEVRLKLWKLQGDYLLELEDAVVATKNKDGKVKLNQAINLPLAGAASGGFWGTLIGLMFLNPLLGAAIGASSGAVAGALSDVGINDPFMEALAEKLVPNSSALFVLIRNVTMDKVVEQIQSYGGSVMQSSLSHTDEARLQAALMASTPAAA